MADLRQLTNQEIDTLQKNGCRCSDWTLVEVAQEFNPSFILNTHFSGRVRIGSTGSVLNQSRNGLRSGIFNAAVHNCTIGRNVLISNVGELSNYVIEDNTVIENTGSLRVTCPNSFGNGSIAAVINEAGGREVPIYDCMNAQTAAVMALMRHRSGLIAALTSLVQSYANSVIAESGRIAGGTSIKNSSIIENVNFGPWATIEGASYLRNATIISSQDEPSYIGPGVYAKNFIACRGSKISEAANIHNCFIGEAVEISRGFSAENCLFFANSVFHNGEAANVFAGPFTTSHHKSSLLIAGMFSFYNAGSGTNQSNHLYKLGPVHQGILARGCKTGSGSYIVWPTRIGAFSTVTGKVGPGIDTTYMPFSYILGNSNKTLLIPGTALKAVGTLRDIQKWPKRDRRKDSDFLDLIIYDGLSPYTVQNMIAGRNLLENFKTAAGSDSVDTDWNGTTIQAQAIQKGISYYDLGIVKYLGEELLARLGQKEIPGNSELRQALTPSTLVGQGRWADIAGLLVPEEALTKLFNAVENGTIKTIQDFSLELKKLYSNYEFYKWSWVSSCIENRLSTSVTKIMPEDIISILHDYKYAVEQLGTMIIEDAQKEFEGIAKTGYGFDGEASIKDADFEAVRGQFGENEFVKLVKAANIAHIRQADELIAKLKKI